MGMVALDPAAALGGGQESQLGCLGYMGSPAMEDVTQRPVKGFPQFDEKW